MGYTHTTLASLKTQLSGRLHDTSKVFFLDAELGGYITEALRTFSLLTSYWRVQQSVSTVASTVFYDLPTALPLYVGHTVTDRNLIVDMEYHLQEAPTTVWAGGWAGTAQFTMSDVSNALQRRRDQFLVDTGVVITRSTSAPVPADGRIALADTIIDIRRLAWMLDAATYSQLWRVDEYELTAYSTGWFPAAAITPTYYSIMSPPPITVQLAPAPSTTNTLEILSVSTGASLSPTAAATVLGVPDDMAWIVKWGALADLLSKDGPAMDPHRAEYCEKRYQHGVALAKASPMLLTAKITNVPLIITSIYDMDSYSINWQNTTAATPTNVLLAGRNLMAVYPPPVGVTTLTLDLVQNAPIPVNDAANVELGRETLEAILDYSEHLAMFKIAGEEWQATNNLFENFMRHASVYNSRLGAATKFLSSLMGKPTREEVERPRILEAKDES